MHRVGPFEITERKTAVAGLAGSEMSYQERAWEQSYEDAYSLMLCNLRGKGERGRASLQLGAAMPSKLHKY